MSDNLPYSCVRDNKIGEGKLKDQPEIIVTYGKFGDVFTGDAEPKYKSLCSFCKNSKESLHIYLNHTVRNCPVIKNCICPLCGQKGHTLSHCYNNPSKPSVTKLIGIFNNSELTK